MVDKKKRAELFFHELKETLEAFQSAKEDEIETLHEKLVRLWMPKKNKKK